MGGKSPPSPPNPQQVAAQQTNSNVQTAMANAALNNVNTFGPLGNTTYNRTGEFQTIEVKLPSGRTQRIQVPMWESHQTLSRDQQKLLDLQEQAGRNLGQTAVQQSAFLKQHLAGGIDRNALPAGVSDAPGAPQFRTATGITPEYRDSIQRGEIQNSFGDAGQIQRSIGANDFSADRQRVEDALYSRLNPQLDRDKAALEQRLANQGIAINSEAWNRAMDQHGRNANDARMQTVIAGGAEQSRLFGMDQARGQFANSAQQQAYDQNLGRAAFSNQAQDQGFQQEAAANQFYNQAQGQRATDRLREAEHGNQVQMMGFDAQNTEMQNQQTLRQQALQEEKLFRDQPLSELSQLLHGSSPTMPQFTSWTPSQIANTPVGQYYYNSAALQNQAYAQQMQQQNAMLGGIAGLGSAGMFMLSDRRAKTDIKKVGKLDNGLPIFSYKYRGSDTPQIGLMAQDVEKVHPEAIGSIGGWKAVDYSKAVQPVEA